MFMYTTQVLIKFLISIAPVFTSITVKIVLEASRAQLALLWVADQSSAERNV